VAWNLLIEHRWESDDDLEKRPVTTAVVFLCGSRKKSPFTATSCGVSCRVVSINCDWTLLICYHMTTKFRPSIPRIDYSSTFKPIYMVTSCNHIVTKPSNDTRYTTHDETVNPALTHIMDCGINSTTTTTVHIWNVVASILASWQPWNFPWRRSFNFRKTRPSSAFVSAFFAPLYTRLHYNTVFTSSTSSALVNKWCELWRNSSLTRIVYLFKNTSYFLVRRNASYPFIELLCEPKSA